MLLLQIRGGIKRNCIKIERNKPEQDTRRNANVNRAVAEGDEPREDVTTQSANGTFVVARDFSFNNSMRKEDLYRLGCIPASIGGKSANFLIDSRIEITVFSKTLCKGTLCKAISGGNTIHLHK